MESKQRIANIIIPAILLIVVYFILVAVFYFWVDSILDAILKSFGTIVPILIILIGYVFGASNIEEYKILPGMKDMYYKRDRNNLIIKAVLMFIAGIFMFIYGSFNLGFLLFFLVFEFMSVFISFSYRKSILLSILVIIATIIFLVSIDVINSPFNFFSANFSINPIFKAIKSIGINWILVFFLSFRVPYVIYQLVTTKKINAIIRDTEAEYRKYA